MSAFDRIDRAHRRPPPITAPKPEAGDECADPRCRGRFEFQPPVGIDPEPVPLPTLVCSGCGTEVWL